MEIKIIENNKELIPQAADWFHEKWGIPKAAYLDSMIKSIENTVPQWYIVLDGEKIVAGLGVIENDFHNRKDLTPNICAVYVEKEYRNRGIAGDLLHFACEDFKEKGINTLYLVTDHTGFYEKYGWGFLCEVQSDGEKKMSRMYIHKT